MSTLSRNPWRWRLLRSLRHWSQAGDASGDIVLALIATAVLVLALLQQESLR